MSEITTKSDELTYLAQLRRDLLDAICGVENAGPELWWDSTTPNSVTRTKLRAILERQVAGAKRPFGIHLVTRHADCPNKQHDGYPTVDAQGNHVVYRGQGYVWGGVQLYSGLRWCKCPCSPANRVTEHYVIDDLVYEAEANIEAAGRVAEILHDVSTALDCAGEKKPRSGVREFLLRAILHVNDELLPEPMEKYIESLLPKHERN